ncbi:hypothetical protein [Occallatibacter riparius]|uniref:Uncharacterized protein n=1 Tax=Occallatibacter riparius TaxID=1002689 RepID=A0A9J7BL11_9BACT|nr:hypothetical protein [Occallatibacter riparius]UWZ83299.1 hypothetical protein MOP44_22350 [Occallatibacter riparius]
MLLRRDDAAEGVPAREHDAAVINLRLGCWCALERRVYRSVRQGTAAGWAPVGLVVSSENGVALGADALHQL